MIEKLHDNKAFKNTDYSEKTWSGQEFDTCTFSNSNLSKNEFIDCLFESCNLSMARLDDSGLRNVKFLNCKLIGIDFSNCHDSLLSFFFERCILDYAVFIKTKIRKTTFDNCIIKEADFTGADLTNSSFPGCDLTGAVFQGTNLEKVDFRYSINFNIDPEVNWIKKARFSITGIAGLLNKYDIDIE
jgi:fluoroquinolone resistance protein